MHSLLCLLFVGAVVIAGVARWYRAEYAPAPAAVLEGVTDDAAELEVEVDDRWRGA